MNYLAAFLDAFLRLAAPLIPGVCSGGVTHEPGQRLTHWDRWTEPGAYMVQVGRLELVLDRG